MPMQSAILNLDSSSQKYCANFTRERSTSFRLCSKSFSNPSEVVTKSVKKIIRMKKEYAYPCPVSAYNLRIIRIPQLTTTTTIKSETNTRLESSPLKRSLTSSGASSRLLQRCVWSPRSVVTSPVRPSTDNLGEIRSHSY